MTKKLISATALAFLLSTGAAFAQTTGASTTSTGASTTGSTVGTPNTGAGGSAAVNLAVLGSCAAIALGAAAVLARRRIV